jgi:hypothetical protein
VRDVLCACAASMKGSARCVVCVIVFLLTGESSSAETRPVAAHLIMAPVRALANRQFFAAGRDRRCGGRERVLLAGSEISASDSSPRRAECRRLQASGQASRAEMMTRWPAWPRARLRRRAGAQRLTVAATVG